MKPLFEECFEQLFPLPTPPTVSTPTVPTPTEDSSDTINWIPFLVIFLVLILIIVFICSLVYFYKKRTARIVQVPNTSTASTTDVTPQSTGL